ncbi:Flagellar motor switch protein FliG [Candidatus Magnetaquicoccaceae bacterium FCR-1]|uniref:Flagellar motor switch protein FliG n=1 Tax=Candidatus Magnetaquiglobus chichijimensis TaxID=3141448 RepID=A0ABQ0C9H9_9PROT
MSHERVARILTLLDRRTADRLLGFLESRESELARTIREGMVLFEDLSGMDRRELETLLHQVPDETLVTALRGADAALVARFRESVSKQRAETLREALAFDPPPPRSRVERARREILETARLRPWDSRLGGPQSGG